ncbi:MAG: integrase [Burkholderiales bacterium]|nr:integrase [Burkholderiales bacterium]
MGKSTQERSGADLKDLEPGRFATVRRIEHGGALQARALAGGVVQFYWRYTHNGKSDRLAVGTYDSSAPPKSLSPTARGYSIAAAAEACRVLAMKHLKTRDEGGIRRQQELKRREHEAALLAEAAIRKQQEQERAAAKNTLGKLLTTYADHLQAQKRHSHADVRSIFRLHLETVWPELCKRAANSISAEEIADVIRSVAQGGKGRTSNKLRAYLRAAYQCALDAKFTGTLPEAFKAFLVTSNPVASTKRDKKFDKADKRPLSIEELRVYWGILKNLPGTEGRALRLHLLTGGQRIEQLLRLTKSQVKGNEITLIDAKGPTDEAPRAHKLPVLPSVQSDLDSLVSAATEGEFVFSTSKGKRKISNMTMLNWAKAAVGSDIEEFQLKRIRSGVETALAKAKVSLEHRGHLQSHGISGVQRKHYDGHDYMEQKLEALQVLLKLIEATDA